MTSPDNGAVATRVMLELLGRRWTWPRKRVIEEYWVPETVETIVLVGRPVSGINSVTDRAGTEYAYELSDAFRLRIPGLCGWGWPFSAYPNVDSNGAVYPQRGCGLHLRVDYIYGCPPPPDVQAAIDEIAGELSKAQCGESCSLPERVTSVAREGISFTVLDPQQFLEGGKFGLYYPDLILSAYNGKNRVRARARVYSPEHSPPRRLSSQLVDGIPIGSPDLILDGGDASP